MLFPDWVTPVSEIILSLGVIVALLQLFFHKRNAKKEATRHIRAQTISMMREWEENVDYVQATAEKLVGRFDGEQCRKLCELRQFEVSAEYGDLIEIATGHAVEDARVDRSRSVVTLSLSETARIKFLTVKYLNSLEIMLSSWHEDLVDREVLESEFQFFIDKKTGDNGLENFRMAMGGAKAYPIIEQFAKRLEERAEESVPKPRGKR